jgi:hypothetical protein
MHYGAPHAECPLLHSLAFEFREAVNKLLESDVGEPVRDMFMDRRNPKASRAHFVIAMEDTPGLRHRTSATDH